MKTKRTRMLLEQKVDVLDRPSECPWCGGSLSMRVNTPKRRTGCIYSFVRCKRCNRQWKETYILSDMTGTRGKNRK